jgi:hypothetical protein
LHCNHGVLGLTFWRILSLGDTLVGYLLVRHTTSIALGIVWIVYTSDDYTRMKCLHNKFLASKSVQNRANPARRVGLAWGQANLTKVINIQASATCHGVHHSKMKRSHSLPPSVQEDPRVAGIDVPLSLPPGKAGMAFISEFKELPTLHTGLTWYNLV